MRFRFWFLGAVVTVSGVAIDKSPLLELRSSESAQGPRADSFSSINALTNYMGRSLNVRADNVRRSASPTVVPSVGAYSSVGCYTESTTWRALRDKSLSDTAMTVEMCATTCSGYTWFGVEYANECYCGNVLQSGSVLVTGSAGAAACDMACDGKSSENCGGPAHLQMYNNLKKAGTSTSKSTSKTTSASHATSTSKTSTSSTLKTSTTLKASTTSAKPSTTTTSKSSTTTSKTLSPKPTGRAVFAHYMVGGISQDQANTDVQQAQAMGIDAFALNVVTSTESWSNEAVECLFNAATAAGFKLFFSFDMTQFSSPTDAIPLLQQYYTSSAYYKHNGLSFVSTFNGGTMTFGYSSPNAGWQATYRNALNSLSIPTYFVPVFDDSPVDPSSFFSTFPVVDGLFAWEGSWPWESEGKVAVNLVSDQAYFNAAQAAGKSFMMGISSIQFKHMESYLNYYRTGGLNLALRISQVLSLGPDFVQIQTWNDAGESHYIGSIWPWAISGTNIPSYTDGYDHSGWQILLEPFVSAYKNGVTDISQLTPTGGASVQGVFWHATLLSTASCSGDGLGKPSGSENIQDVIDVALIVAPGLSGVKVNVYSGNNQVGSFAAVQGLNAWEVHGLGVGEVSVVVQSSTGATLLSGTGPISVMADSNNCNYNPQVVALG